MNKTTEALKLAEETLRDIIRVYKFETGTPVTALATIRAARAQEQAEQEPVAWYFDTFDEDGELDYREYNTINEFSCGRGNGTPLYAAPVSVEAAVIEEREACAKVCDDVAKAYQIQGMLVADECAAAIRARGEK